MRELHIEGVAIDDDPEPCAGIREAVGEAWDRDVQAGCVSRSSPGTRWG